MTGAGDAGRTAPPGHRGPRLVDIAAAAGRAAATWSVRQFTVSAGRRLSVR